MVALTQRLLASFVLASICNAQKSGEGWWDKPFGMFQTNIRDIDYDIDTNQTADYIISHGATAWLQSVGGILAQYPSKLDFHEVNPLLAQRPGGDVVADTIAAAKPRGIRVLARMDFSKVSRRIATAHPEWLYVSPKGKEQSHPRDVVSVCPSTAWYQERTFDILGEILDKYKDIDGFFVNWASYNERDYFRVYHGVCHCNACKTRWDERPKATGRALPLNESSADYAEWKTFSDDIVLDWTARVQKFIMEKKPDLAFVQARDTGNVKFYEANNAIDRDIWHYATGEAVSKAKSNLPDVPVLVNCASFIDHAYRITSEEPYHYGQYHLQAIARGANPSTYVIGVPQKLPFSNLGIAGQVVRFHKQHQDTYAGMRPSARVALVAPQQSQINSTQWAEVLSEYKGLYKSLQELHVPFDIIAQENIVAMNKSSGLSRYSTLIAGNLGKLKDADARILDEWTAKAGHTLIVTGAVGINRNASHSTQLKSLPVSSQREFRTKGDLWSTYFAPEQNRTQENYYTYPLIPILGSYGLYEWKNGTRGRYKQLGYAPFAPMEYVAGNRQIEERGVGIGSYGQGTAVLVPFPVGFGYQDMGLSQFRDFFELVLKEAGVKSQFEFIGLAEQVEVTVNVNAKNETVLHLSNMSGMRHQNFGKHLPIPASSFKIVGAGSGVKVRSLAGNATLEVKDGEFQVPGIDLFEVLVIEGL